MTSLIYLRGCQNISKWHSFRMLSKIFPNSVLWRPFMSIPLPPVEMDHSHTLTIHLTTISLSMLVSDMMPPKHVLRLRGEMFMQLLVPRISTLLKNPTRHIFLRILTLHQMTFIRYTRPNIAENPPHHYLASRKITPESLPLLHPRNYLRNMMSLNMSLLRFINSSVLKQLLP